MARVDRLACGGEVADLGVPHQVDAPAPGAGTLAHLTAVVRRREGVRFGRGLEDVRLEIALGKSGAELQAHEGARRVARRRGVVVALHVGDHREIGVGDRGIEVEAVVVDDERHLPADGAALPSPSRAGRGRRRRGADLEAFEIEEDRVALRVVADALGEAEAEKRLLEAHHLGAKDARVHRRRRVDDRAQSPYAPGCRARCRCPARPRQAPCRLACAGRRSARSRRAPAGRSRPRSRR